MTFESASEKRAFVRRLFSDLAPRYELVNQVISLGQVRAWRRYSAAQVSVPAGGTVLDVAAGEGGLSLALVSECPGVRVTSVDFTPEMVQRGRVRTAGRSVSWAEGDALRLPFSDESFDAVAGAFMLRNVTDVKHALAEQTRVVQPGGRVVCLEMAWPRNPLFRPLFWLYFAVLAPVLGWLLTGRMYAYRYLPRSVQSFAKPEEVSAIMESVGLRLERCRLMSLGSVAVHVGVKP